MTRRDRLLLAFATYQQGRMDPATFRTVVDQVLPPDPVEAAAGAPAAPTLVSVREASRQARVTRSTVYAWITTNQVDAVYTADGAQVGLESVLARAGERARALSLCPDGSSV